MGHSEQSKSRWRWLAGGIVVVLACLAVASTALYAGDGPIEGLTLEGIPLRNDAPLDEQIEACAASWLDTPITIDGATAVLSATRRELGAEIDLAATQVHIRELGRTGSPFSALEVREAARRGDLDARLLVSVQRGQLRDWVSRLQPRIERAAVPAVIGSGGATVPGLPGVSLGLIAGVTSVRRALLQRQVYVQLPVMSNEPPQRAPVSLRDASFSELVAAYETQYAPRAGGGRSRNIERAARLLHGAVIAPGGTVSFNDRVGERSLERGFHGATELRSGRRVDGVGGGVCQVAATLYAAAFLGGFDVVEHHPHSRNLRYVEAGLDAAVVWDRKDLIVRNPFPHFVRVQAFTEGRTLRVELFGSRSGPIVEWSADVLEEVAPGVERVASADLPSGEERVVDEGEPGLLVEVSRIVRAESGTRRDVRRVRYPVADRIVEVGQ